MSSPGRRTFCSQCTSQRSVDGRYKFVARSAGISKALPVPPRNASFHHSEIVCQIRPNSKTSASGPARRPYHRPAFHFFGEGHCGVGRAGRGEIDAAHRGIELHVLPEQVTGFRAVEADELELWVRVEELREVIWNHAVVANGKIEAARPMRGGTNIPQRYAGFAQPSNALGVRNLHGDAKELLDDAPEGIARMGVILAAPERLLSRKRAQDQDPRSRRRYWMKTRGRMN